MTRGSGSGEAGSPEAGPPETGSPAVLDHLVYATPDLDRTLAEIAGPTGPGAARAELAALGVRWPGEPVTAGPTGLTAVLAGRHGRVAFGRGAVAV
ncbi:hypothetical protein [Streptomyces decoyicus]|uniref:hypothetical protein n=1 Tax=Streptomyces decoyicus TaxID=249567 RepID=UPI0033AF27F1